MKIHKKKQNQGINQTQQKLHYGEHTTNNEYFENNPIFSNISRSKQHLYTETMLPLRPNRISIWRQQPVSKKNTLLSATFEYQKLLHQILWFQQFDSGQLAPY